MGYTFTSILLSNSTAGYMAVTGFNNSDVLLFSNGDVYTNGALTQVTAPSGFSTNSGTDINSSGVILGYTTGVNYPYFTNTIGGTATFVSPPNGFGFLYANDLNDSGVVVGYFDNSSGIIPFLYTGTGNATLLSNPISHDVNSTYLTALNNSNWTIGAYTTNNGFQTHGVLYTPVNGGTWTTIDDPVAAGTNATTRLIDINNAGQIIGSFNGSNGFGYFLYGGGQFTTISDPLAAAGRTTVTAMNNSGEVVGWYVDTAGVTHGFTYLNGTYTTIDDPSASKTVVQGNFNYNGTIVYGVNDSGDLVGTYYDAATNAYGGKGVPHYFIAAGPPPSVTGVSSTATGTIGPTSTIEIDVHFSGGVIVNGSPTLALSDGGTATYDSKTSNPASGLLAFDYTPLAGQNTTDLKVTSLSATAPNTITSGAGAAAIVTGAANQDLKLIVDTTAPAVSKVVANPATGAFNGGDTVGITLTLTEAATVNTKGGTPYLTLDDGGHATYASGSGTTSLLFNYKVGNGENSAALKVTGSNPNGGSITDAAGNIADITKAPTTFTGLVIDTTAPTVTGVAGSPTSGTLLTGGTDTITLTLSEKVNVSGHPVLTLDDGGTAAYASGSGTNALVFKYTVAGTQHSSDLHLTGVDLSAAGSAITDLAGNAADLTGAAADLKVAVVMTPAVSGVTSTPTAGGAVPNGGAVVIKVATNEAVVLAGPGTPSLTLSNHGVATYDTVNSHPDQDLLVFNYTAGAKDTNGDVKITAFTLPTGTTLTDGNGHAVNTAAALVDLGVTVDTVAPAVTAKLIVDTGALSTDGITSNPALTGTGNSGATVHFTVNGHSEAATATGDAKTGAWTFTPSTDLVQGSNTIVASETDAAGNTGTATVKFTLDTVTPTVHGVSSVPGANSKIPLNGTVTITLDLGEALKVTGSPTLTLSDGETTKYVATSSNLATGVLAFSYKAAANHTAADLTIAPITLGTGVAVTDLAGNAANLTLTATQADLKLSVDTLPPTVQSVATTLANGTTVPSGGIKGAPVEIDVTTSESVVVTNAAGLTLTLSDHGVATYDSVHSTATKLIFDHTPAAGQNTTDLKTTALVLAKGTTVTDLAGNPLVLTGAANQDLHIAVDTVAPVVTDKLTSDTGVSSTDKITSNPALNGTGDPNATVHFTVNGHSEAVTATASSTGAWAFTPSTDLVQGSNTIVASETDAAGNIGQASLTFTLDTTTPTVQSVTQTVASGTHIGLNGTDVISLHLGEALKVTGTPTLTLSDGESASYSATSSDLADGILAFSYKAAVNHTDSDLHITQVTLPAGASVTDLAGHNANLALSTGQADLGLVVDTAPTQMHINLIQDASVASAPAGFMDAVTKAANYLDQTFADNITVNIDVTWNQGASGDTAESWWSSDSFQYSDVYNALTSHAAAIGDSSVFASLPSVSTFTTLAGGNGTYIDLGAAQQKALGLFSGNSTDSDGTIDFGSGTSSVDWYQLAVHEITHAMGRTSGSLSEMDLFRFSGPGAYAWTTEFHQASGGWLDNRSYYFYSFSNPAYFSINDGQTHLARFGENNDSSDWFYIGDGLTPNDPFNEFVQSSGKLSHADMLMMEALGFTPNTPVTAGQGSSQVAAAVVSGSGDSTAGVHGTALPGWDQHGLTSFHGHDLLHV